jgi:hypothetical protein
MVMKIPESIHCTMHTETGVYKKSNFEFWFYDSKLSLISDCSLLTYGFYQLLKFMVMKIPESIVHTVTRVYKKSKLEFWDSK